MKILIIENNLSAYNKLKNFVERYKGSGNINYEVITSRHYPSEDGTRHYDRDEVYRKIKEDISLKIDEFDVLLIDLLLFDSEDSEAFDFKNNQLVSIQIMNELEPLLKDKNKKFFFVTGSSGELEVYYEYKEMHKGWPVLHKPYKEPDNSYEDCPYQMAEFKPGCNFEDCSIKDCFMSIISI